MYSHTMRHPPWQKLCQEIVDKTVDRYFPTISASRLFPLWNECKHTLLVFWNASQRPLIDRRLCIYNTSTRLRDGDNVTLAGWPETVRWAYRYVQPHPISKSVLSMRRSQCHGLHRTSRNTRTSLRRARVQTCHLRHATIDTATESTSTFKCREWPSKECRLQTSAAWYEQAEERRRCASSHAR